MLYGQGSLNYYNLIEESLAKNAGSICPSILSRALFYGNFIVLHIEV
jgi:hypothetical protein